ncbi:hypothetical protein FACS1894172_12800 [Spirochaetia bacterium]|nr:hypothetical protein FACS1894172_12800 [Spirochaetia bacterium]
MKIRFLLLFLLLGFSVIGLEWPMIPATLFNNFGANDSGTPHLGLSFENDGAIASTDHGEILFIHSEGEKASRLASPLGTWVAVDHGEGLIGVYSRSGESDVPVKNTVEAGTVLGVSGRSGWSNRQGFHFSLYDRKERHWVNPAMLLPPAPDSRPPVIQSVQLRNEDGLMVNPTLTRRIPQGMYSILVTITDLIDQNENPLAPQSISCFVNGAEIGFLHFEIFSVRDGTVMAYRSTPVPAELVYTNAPAFEAEKIWLTSGQTTIEVVAQDLQGRSRSAIFTIVVD